MTDKHITGRQSVLWRYGILLFIAVIPVFLVTLWQAIKHRDLLFLCQRFGFLYPNKKKHRVCIHAASVGEVLAVRPLINKMQHEYQNPAICISTVTPTGGRIARQQLSGVQHVYLPLDIRWFVKKFLRATSPQCVLIMETELWPNLFASCHHRQIPLITINGRLSQRTIKTKTWVKELYRITLSNVTAVLARSAVDADLYIELGANPQHTMNVGNLKFAIAEELAAPTTKIEINRPYVLAASTHNNEEEIITQVWQSLASLSRLLIIAPRHPYRTAEILKQLKPMSLNIAVRSRNDQITAHTDVYLADTLGELLAFMQQADLVFMGGSLVPVGGHNILEPAMLKKAIVFGPHMQNFSDETELFLNQHAAIQIQDEHQLRRCLVELLASEDKRHTLGERAKIVVQQNKNILDDYLKLINQYCPLSN